MFEQGGAGGDLETATLPRSAFDGGALSVQQVLVQAGDAVTEGQPLLAIEAMKMEDSISAPIDGVVRVHVTTGEQVPADHLLATVEPHPSTDESEGAGDA